MEETSCKLFVSILAITCPSGIYFMSKFSCPHMFLKGQYNEIFRFFFFQELVVALVGKSYEEMKQSLTSVRDKYHESTHLGP